ncbi:MAG TPA: hypothetical protein VLJ11_08540 [Bryobacteraceae bacterium]|nr:hypothetical protein [Bryobacteraceae bacterium]
MKDVSPLSRLATMFVLGCTIVSGATVTPPREETLCIHLYNLAHVPPQTMEWATAEAGKIFERVGIRIRWEQPSAELPEAHLWDLNVSVAALLSARERSCLVVGVMQDLPAVAYPGALGFALPLARSGVSAELLYGRIERTAAAVGASPEVLLAYTMTHEIGHVLLQSSAHAAAGIMQALWDAGTWRLASFGMVAFLPEEARKMHQGLWRFTTPTQNVSPERNSVLAETHFSGGR